MLSRRRSSSARSEAAKAYHAWYRSARWLRERAQHLRQHPFCGDCMRAGRQTKATTVDHIQPHRGNWVLFWDRSNWQSQCDVHHTDKQRIENGGKPRTPVGLDGWPLSEGGYQKVAEIEANERCEVSRETNRN